MIKLSQTIQETLMNGISDAIVAVDDQGRPLFFNSRFAKFSSSPQFKQSPDLWHMFEDQKILDAFRNALTQGKSSQVQALPFHQDNSGPRIYSISVSPLKKASDEVYAAVGIFHDVTDLKRAEQMRIDFVANVSHELRTPLTSIKGYVDTLLADLEADRPIEKGFLDIIGRNSVRLISLINDLLDLSSLESQESQNAGLNKTQVSTQEITQRVLSGSTKERFEQSRDIEIHYDASEVYGDAGRIEQVLVNLIDNAKKYTPTPGKIILKWRHNKRGDTVFEIKDSGPGISPEHHARLFERFYRVDKARSREIGGTGLGLAIVKHIMQRHGGDVWIESQPGKGSRFFCRFPGNSSAG